MDNELQAIQDADRALVRVARDLKVLSAIAWPPQMAEAFLTGWRAGQPTLPEPPPVTLQFDDRLPELERLARPVSDHPMAHFVARTAHSYELAARMIGKAGTADFTALSIELYGRPDDPVTPGGLTNLAAADNLVNATDELGRAGLIDERDYCLLPSYVRDEIQRRFDAFFTDRPVAVTMDETLTAKAAAGASAIRLRTAVCFSYSDIEQLVNHEGLVHTATLINGRRQPILTCMGMSTPRTTATQEGLATFAELITNSMDLARLRRLALRIQGIDAALGGADFIEVFRLFLDSGQTETESYFSTARVFRGGDPRGSIAFTKDIVYLRGLLRTQAYFLAALESRKVQFAGYLFSGRLTWGDVLELEPYFESKLVAPARYVPPWLSSLDRLAAHLAFSSLTHHFPVHDTRLEHFHSPALRTEELADEHTS